eukprot:gene27925-48851_t
MRDGVEQSLKTKKDAAEWQCRQCARLNHFMDTVCGGGDIMFGLPMGCGLSRNIIPNAPVDTAPVMVRVQMTPGSTGSSLGVDADPYVRCVRRGGSGLAAA